MKNLILFAIVAVSITACTATAEKKHAENIELVKSYVESVEEMDFNAMDKFLDDNYLGIGPSYGDTIGKNEAIENWKFNVTNTYEKIHYNRSRFASVTIPDGENKGDWVVNWAELHIDYKNSGGSATIWANSNYLVEKGKIIRSLTFYNEADALRQLGYRMVP